MRLCDGTADKDANVVDKGRDYISYSVNNENGKLTIEEFLVFPGIWLCFKEAHAESFTYPESYPVGLLEINHCRDGRFEYDAGDHFFYLAAGDISVSKSREQKAVVYCPTKYYQGIAVLIDPAAAPPTLSKFLADVNVRPEELLKKLCGDDGFFIMRATEQLEHIFSELYSVPKEMQKGYFKIKVLELLMFLNRINPEQSQTKQKFCAGSQVELAKSVCRFINSNMNSRITIDQLAAEFYVSPAKLKKCFYSVYSESIYAYIRAYKISAAALELRSTDKTITEIAGDHGYGNVSKFSKAFRDIMGVSPSEYRQLSQEQNSFLE